MDGSTSEKAILPSNPADIDHESDKDSTMTEESILEELEGEQSSSSAESETVLDLTPSNKSTEQTDEPRQLISSATERRRSATSDSSKSSSSTSSDTLERSKSKSPATTSDEADYLSSNFEAEDESKSSTPKAEEHPSNGVISNSKLEEKDCDSKKTTGVSVNKTILTDKISPTPQKIPTSSTSSNEDYTDDPTMPDIETLHCPKNIMRDLAEPDFDMWRLDRDSMVDHIEYMYHDLGIVRAWKIPRTTLKMFLLGVRERYQDNPYHNFKHCFCVTQMAYSMLCKLRLRGLISVDQMGALLTAAVCHDVDHPGLSNTYHCHARTPLAILYNYQSILEQHHFAVTCRILSNKERNIFRNVQNRDGVLTDIGDLILATDLAQHKKITENYTNCISEGFDFENSGHVMALLKMIIKCADVSNEVRPETVSAPWVERLFAEYFEQSAREKREHLPVTSYMDPDTVNISESQEGFIRGVMLPLYHHLGKLIVEAQPYYIDPIYETLSRYEVQNNSRKSKV